MEPTNRVQAHGSCNKDKCTAAAAATNTKKEKHVSSKMEFMLAQKASQLFPPKSLFPLKQLQESHHQGLKREK